MRSQCVPGSQKKEREPGYEAKREYILDQHYASWNITHINFQFQTVSQKKHPLSHNIILYLCIDHNIELVSKVILKLKLQPIHAFVQMWTLIFRFLVLWAFWKYNFANLNKFWRKACTKWPSLIYESQLQFLCIIYTKLYCIGPDEVNVTAIPLSLNASEPAVFVLELTMVGYELQCLLVIHVYNNCVANTSMQCWIKHNRYRCRHSAKHRIFSRLYWGVICNCLIISRAETQQAL